MRTGRHTYSGSAALLILLVLLVAPRTAVAAVAPHGSLHTTQTLALQRVVRSESSYSWPVKPFDRQHPVRAFFNDPRIGDGGSHAFHFGIDVAAPDGTPVYAVAPGTVYFDSGRAIAVVAPDRSHTFGYWHIRPGVRSHQFVQRHQLLGWIDAGWGHVHFAETRSGHYVNPLRPGALTPYVDRRAPSIVGIEVAQVAGGAVAITTEAYDTTWPRVPGAWAGEPVTPVLIQLRLLHNGHAGPWHDVVDFRTTMLDAKTFGTVYTAATRQNHKAEPGRFCFCLAHTWHPASGRYRIEVRAWDTGGNRADAWIEVTVT